MITYHTCKLIIATESTDRLTEKDVKHIITNMLQLRQCTNWRYSSMRGTAVINTTATKPRRCFTIPKPGPITHYENQPHNRSRQRGLG